MPNILQDKKILILLVTASLLVFITIIFAISFIFRPQTTPTGLPTPTPIINSTRTTEEQKISSLQKSLINTEVPSNIESLPDYESKTTLPNGDTKYTLKSPLVGRKNEVLSRNGVATFERILTPEKSTAPGYAKISDYTKVFGEPEQSFRGSLYYGPLISTLIYTSKGFTLVGNTNTDEVYEIQVYEPMSIESYKNLYGEDIQENQEFM